MYGSSKVRKIKAGVKHMQWDTYIETFVQGEGLVRIYIHK